MIHPLALAAVLGAGASLLAVARPVACLDALATAALAVGGFRSRRMPAATGTLHWLERSGGTPAVVLLHGLGASAERWFPILPGFLGGRRLLVPSLPAHGRSSAPRQPFGVVEVARWMGEWTDRMIPAGGADLIGFSMGGWIAAHMVLQRPERVRRLILASSAGVRLDPPPARRLLAPETVEDVRNLVEILTVRPLPLPGFVLRDLLRRARPERRWLVESALRGEGLLEDSLERIRQPTLVVWGKEDRLIPPEAGRRLAAGIRGARVVEMEGCGHLPYWERRAEFRRVVEAFLA